MNLHPALLMVSVWLSCIGLFTALPFELVDREFTSYGFIILVLFIGAFCLGTTLKLEQVKSPGIPVDLGVNFSRTDKILKIAALIAVGCFLLDLYDKDIFDLGASYWERSERAQDLLAGRASTSSLAFRFGFILYPAAYVYLVREIGFEKKYRPLQIILFGILPPVMAAIALGGRTPILYGLLLMLLALTIKKTVGRRLNYEGPQTRNLKLYYIVAITFGLLSFAAIYYFAQVFVVRAIESGGIRFMFDYAENYWGIKFSGDFANFMIQVLGQELTYVVFVFSWYFSQGLLMSNYLFSGYDGPMLLGVYGIDLIAAIMRRLDGDSVAHGYDLLLKINVYGFFPSAFGALYVDLKFLGLPVCLLWGWFAGVVYRKNHAGIDHRWWLLMPFIVLGIVFSLINTPLGFSNGFVTHIWVAIGFFSSSRIIGKNLGQ